MIRREEVGTAYLPNRNMFSLIRLCDSSVFKQKVEFSVIN